MDEDDDDESINQDSPLSRSQINPNHTKSLIQVQRQKNRLMDKNESCSSYRNDFIFSSTSKTEPHVYVNTIDDTKERFKVVSSGSIVKKPKLYSDSSLVMKECWKASSNEVPKKFINLFKETNLKEGMNKEEEDSLSNEKMKYSTKDEKEKLYYTQEFHILTEVQKAKILNVVEDTIKKLANGESWQEEHPTGDVEDNKGGGGGGGGGGGNVDRFFCRKFLLPWLFMKVVEMILCHLIQIIFLSNNSFYERKSEFFPIFVTFYLTLLIVVLSLVLHVTCYSCIGIQNPCYFMGVISSSVITLTTSSGTFVLLCSLDYYKTFREIIVLVLLCGLLCTLVAELCIFYVEVKNFWNMIGTNDQYYTS